MHDKDDRQLHNAEQQQPAPRQPRKEGHRPPPQRFGKGSKKRETKGGGFNWKRVPRTAGIWIFIILIAVVVSQNLPWGGAADGKRVTYTEYRKLLENGRIKRATIVDTHFRGELTEPLTDERTRRQYSYVVVNLGIVDSDMVALWQKYGVEFSFEDKSTSWIGYFVQSLPWLFFLGMWLFLLRQMQGGPKGVFSFGKSRARLLTEDKPKVTFKDVAGAEEAKQELQEIIEFLKDPKKFQRLGGRIPKGVLLVGPPGTGKTYMAKAVAGEAGVPFFSMSGSDFVEMFVGVGASVTGDTPVLIRRDGRTQLMAIGEFVDLFYSGDDEGFVVPVHGVETLSYKELDSKFKGSPKTFVQGSAWQRVRGVYRHRVCEIYEIHYLGGVIRTTGDHSIFVRTRDGIKAIAARDLKPGDVLVNLPLKVRGEYSPEHGTPHTVRAHEFASLREPLYLDVRERDEATEVRHAFALARRDIMSQAAIAAVVGVSQTTVGHWQAEKHQPRALSPNYTETVLPERIPVTLDLMKLFGYYTAEGRENSALEFTFGTHETDLHADCIALMEHVFGIRPKVEHTADNSTKITFFSAPLGRFFSRHCGTGSHNKHVPEWFWDLPREYFEAYFEGYTLGDGYTTGEGKLSVTSVSCQLILELTWLLAMHGIKAGVRRMCLPAGRVIKGKPLPGGEVWNLIVGKTSHPFKPDVSTPHQGKKPVVREVIVKPFDGYVYDLCGCENEAFFGGEKPILLHNSRVRDLFEQGKSNAPCIIFIDELDAVGRHRGAGIGGGHDEREQTLNQLLVEMDGFESNEGVIMIAATNRPDVLDPALLRPGRFDRMVVVDRPDVKGREGILNVHVRLKNIPLSRDVNLGVLARGTPGLSGADLENLINEAALLASRHNRKFVTMEDFENAKDKVMMGTERRSLVISDQEKRLIAYHEIGHALVAKLTPGSDPVHKVMIIPRGRALGLTHLLPIDERRIYQKSYLVGMLSYILGGRCAEKLVFGEVANGAADDLERATALARNMICEWGMSERLGPLTYGKKEEEIFLGREIAQHRDYSERTAELIDEEVKVLIESAERRADQILRENVEKLHALAHVLLELEVLDGTQIDRILAGEKVGKAFTMVSSSEPRSRSIQSDGRSSKRSRRRRRPVKTQQEDTQAQAQNTPVSPVERKVTEPPSDTQRLNDEKKTPEEVVS